MKATTQPLGSLWSRIWAATGQLMISSGPSRTIPASAAGRLGSYKHCDILLCLFPLVWDWESSIREQRKQDPYSLSEHTQDAVAGLAEDTAWPVPADRISPRTNRFPRKRGIFLETQKVRNSSILLRFLSTAHHQPCKEQVLGLSWRQSIVSGHILNTQHVPGQGSASSPLAPISCPLVQASQEWSALVTWGALWEYWSSSNLVLYTQASEAAPRCPAALTALWTVRGGPPYQSSLFVCPIYFS